MIVVILEGRLGWLGPVKCSMNPRQDDPQRPHFVVVANFELGAIERFHEQIATLNTRDKKFSWDAVDTRAKLIRVHAVEGHPI